MTQSLICIKAAKSHNFKRIYVKMMNLGDNIKPDILKLAFCLKWEFWRHVTCYSSFFREEKSENRPPPAEKTCNGYMLKHQRNCLAPVPEKPINLPSD